MKERERKEKDVVGREKLLHFFFSFFPFWFCVTVFIVKRIVKQLLPTHYLFLTNDALL